MNVKKLSLLALVMVSLIFYSCNKNEDLGLQLNDSSSKIANVLSINDFEKQKIAFELLNSDEKYTIWENKLENLINSGELNVSQIEIVRNMLSKFTPEVYTESEYRAYFNTIITKDFVVKANKLFTADELNNYFYSMSGLQDRRYDDGRSCNCNNATIGGFDCSGIDFRHCTAPSAGCRDTSFSCGVFNTSPCDGICRSIF